MKKTFVTLSFFFFLLHAAQPREIRNWVDSSKTILYEKVYLHVDRELFSPGDRIWFKAYLVSGISNQLLPGYKNIFVRLVSDEGKVFLNRILLVRDGISHGDFVITDSIPDGQYTVAAYTKYLENFGEESFFHKRIWILRTKSSMEIRKMTPENYGQIDVSFCPESGDLVLNALNHVAFKAVDASGKGIGISGVVVDENDSIVTAFKTSFRGMGRFLMMPQEGKTYFAKAEGYPGFIHCFTDIQENGFLLSFREEENHVILAVSRNIKKTDKHKIYLVASHKGVVLFYKTVEMDGFTQALKLGKNLFPLGISKITLLDPDFTELAERIVFIGNNNQPTATLRLNKTEFTTRERVTAEISMLLNRDDTMKATLSAAVVNKSYFGSGGNNLNIKSYLLLDSELKGAIESPASYFTDDSLTSAEKLDLLMMVHGWRSYYWNDLTVPRDGELTGWNDAGITVEGYVRALFRNRPVIGGEVVLGPFSRNLLFEETRTDSMGRFRFDRLYLKDSAMIMINAKNEKERARTEIILDPILPFCQKIPPEVLRNVTADISVPLMFYRDNFFRQLKLENFNPEKGNILLDEIEIAVNQVEKNDGHFRIYGSPDRVFKITEEDYSYLNIFDYLEGKVAGVVVTADGISIRGGGMPLFIVDGIKVKEDMVEDMISHINVSDIDKIEMLTSGLNMAVFGSEGGNGVIAVYTRTGNVDKEIERYVKGRIIFRAHGFKIPARFYSPRYTPENINDSQLDYRPTLYWEPELPVENGNTFFEFFTSDELSEYSVIVEGISRNGKICYVTEDFRVTGLHNQDKR